jgi:hypothetical protein
MKFIFWLNILLCYYNIFRWCSTKWGVKVIYVFQKKPLVILEMHSYLPAGADPEQPGVTVSITHIFYLDLGVSYSVNG